MQYDRTITYSGLTNGVVIAGHFNEPDTYVCKRPDGMSDWLITCTLEGEGYVRTPEGERICKAGDIALLKSGTPHEYGTLKGQMWHFYWLHFTQQDLEPYMLPTEPLYLAAIENDSTRTRIHNAFQRILLEFWERNDFWQELCMNALREILILLLQRKVNKIDSRITEVLHLLSKNLHESVDLTSIARSIGLSPSRLSHLFKRETGQTVIDTLNHMRVRQAALLLKHTDSSAAEVCNHVGFQNYNHFIKQFRKYYQVTPTAYRKSSES